MENKFVVLKLDDINDYCSTETQFKLLEVTNEIQEGRKDEGKSPYAQYFVINRDEPYADEIIEVLKRNGHWEE